MDVTGVPEQEGSLGDFRAMYRQHHGFVWHALHRFGTSPTALEDAVQDVFVVAYRRRDTFAGGSTKAWLYGIARRVASNYRRGDRRRTERERAFRLNGPRTATEGTREAIQTLERYLASLAESDRELFILSELEGMTGPEIAEARGRNLRTVYTRIRKLRMGFHADLLSDVKRQRPQASTRAWALLVPALQSATFPPATGWTTLLGSSSFWGSVGAAGAAAMVVVAAQSLPLVPEPVPAEGIVSQAEVSLESDAKPDVVAPTPIAVATAAPSLAEPPTPPRADPRPASDRAPKKPRDVSGTSTLVQENALLALAKVALRDGNPARALELTEEHAQTFRRSVLADLRTAVRIDALCGLERRADARNAATAFFRGHPHSPFSPRIKKSCAVRQENRPPSDTAGT